MSESEKPEDNNEKEEVESGSPEETTTESSEPEAAATPKAKVPASDAKSYWYGSLLVVFIVLSIWAFVSFGCSIIFKKALDKIEIGSAGLGFWMSQQGSIMIFVLLLILYMVLMNKLDKKHGFDEEDDK